MLMEHVQGRGGSSHTRVVRRGGCLRRHSGLAARLTHPSLPLHPPCASTPALQIAATGGGGLVLVRAPSAEGDPLSVLQYISTGAALPYRGVPPCPLPFTPAQLAAVVDGTSLQLVSMPSGLPAAGGGEQWLYSPFNASAGGGWADVSVTGSLGWEAGLPITFGTENAGLLPGGGDFVQVFREATAAELLSGLVSPVDYSPPVTPPPVPNATDIDCAIGPVTEWSQCSLACTPLSTGTGSPTIGQQMRWQPIVTLPQAAGAACPALGNRSELRTCAPTVICTGCTNLRTDGQETGVDCGGRLTDRDLQALLPGRASIHDVVRLLFHPRGEEDAAGLPAPPQQIVPQGVCGRCSMGRACTQHSDCSWDAGLVCASGLDVCTPWRVLNASSFVSVTLELRGADPTAAATGPALTGLLTLIASLSSGNGNSLDPLNVTVSGVSYRPQGGPDAVAPSVAPGNGVRRVRALQGVRGAHGRALAQADDFLALTFLVAAPDSFQASIMRDSINSRRAAGASVAEEAVRPYSPLVQDGTLTEAAVVANPFGTASGAVPPNGEGGVRPVPGNTPADAAPGATGLGGGPIAGIVIGALCAAAIVTAAVVAGVQKSRAAAEERRRAEEAAAARRTGRGINIRETAPQGGAGLDSAVLAGALAPAPASKAAFQPKHAAQVSDTAGGEAAPTEALPGEAAPPPVPLAALLATKPGMAAQPGSPHPPAGSPLPANAATEQQQEAGEGTGEADDTSPQQP